MKHYCVHMTCGRYVATFALNKRDARRQAIATMRGLCGGFFGAYKGRVLRVEVQDSN
jgi:hypothetical protein